MARSAQTLENSSSLFLDECPTNIANYHLIGGQCYFFIDFNIAFDAAQSLCATKFLGGRLFEPRSLTANNDVSQAVADANLGSSWYYIGISDKISNDVLAYESTASSVSITIPWASGHPAYTVNDDCATIYASQKTWVMQQCTVADMAICEKP